ncbi:hypothetical protein B0H17DRAFT_1144148 [Mycena rosella]|uniref:Uncharacterized protein n=1 Tax=Mycena rosella TaxID=1033263 RepID=A0AAD7CTT2_MYCRO|nr:hypothetical protein B0H17DRAFT_1144148 [Mycena rosella]
MCSHVGIPSFRAVEAGASANLRFQDLHMRGSTTECQRMGLKLNGMGQLIHLSVEDGRKENEKNELCSAQRQLGCSTLNAMTKMVTGMWADSDALVNPARTARRQPQPRRRRIGRLEPKGKKAAAASTATSETNPEEYTAEEQDEHGAEQRQLSFSICSFGASALLRRSCDNKITWAPAPLSPPFDIEAQQVTSVFADGMGSAAKPFSLIPNVKLNYISVLNFACTAMLRPFILLRNFHEYSSPVYLRSGVAVCSQLNRTRVLCRFADLQRLPSTPIGVVQLIRDGASTKAGTGHKSSTYIPPEWSGISFGPNWCRSSATIPQGNFEFALWGPPHLKSSLNVPNIYVHDL